MPSALSYPGVYIEEVDSGVRPITGVATSITAFLGRTLRGPVNEPVTVNSYGEFERVFGGLWGGSLVAFTVRDFFQNGGGEAVIVRLFSPAFEKDSEQDAALAAAQAAAAKAASEINGALGTETDPKKLPDAAKSRGDFPAGSAALEAYDFVVAKAKAAADSGKTLAQVDAAAAAAVNDAVKSAAPAVFARFKLAAGGGAFWWLDAATPGTWGNALRVRVDHEVKKKPDGSADTSLFNLWVRDDATGTVELFRNVSIETNNPRRVDRVLETGSALVRAAGGLPTALPAATPVYGGLDPWGDKVPKAGDPPSNVTVTEKAEGDGDPIDRSSFTGAGLEGAKKGLYALEKVDLFNLLCIPPYATDAPIEQDLVGDAIAYCIKRRAMILVDPRPEWEESPDKIKAVLDAVEAEKIGPPNPNAALFFPRLVQANPLQEGREESFPPCGAVAGVFARTDTERGVWKAPAGLEATLLNARRPSVPLTDLENGRLNMRGINCLRRMPGAGTVVWGARTRTGDDRTPNDWKYIPIRRTALFIEESLYRGTQWVVFEPNDEPLWASIRLNIGAFMQRLFRQGAFQGASARDAYFVKCDGETTTQADIDLGVVNILVGFAPLKPAEFVVIKLQQIAGNIPT